MRLKATVNDASTLVEMYYSIGSLVLIKVIPKTLFYLVVGKPSGLLREFLLESSGDAVVHC